MVQVFYDVLNAVQMPCAGRCIKNRADKMAEHPHHILDAAAGQLRQCILPLQAQMEPPWLEACPKDLSKWSDLIDALSVLALRTSALESLLEVLSAPPISNPHPCAPVIS